MSIPAGYRICSLETPNDLAAILEAWRIAPALRQRQLLKQLNVRPSLIYKFRSLRGPFAETNLRDVIIHSALRLAAPAEFNDPYELLVQIVLTSSPVERERRFREIAAAQGAHLSPAERDAMVARLVEMPNDQHIENVLRSLNGIRKNSGVISFAAKPRSILMWSHYADQHRGICFQFQRSRDFPTFGHAVHVSYKEQLPVVNYIVNFHDGTIPLLLSKHAGWSYEEELRITAIDQADRYVQFRPDALCGIIFGCRVDSEGRQLVLELLRQRKAAGMPPVRLFEMVQHPTKYALRARRSPSAIE
jgi:Protein of unknown function (DUF2971)